jgi:hypothetical protein
MDNGVRRSLAAKRPITSSLTFDEHAVFARMAEKLGMTPTGYATKIIRDRIGEDTRSRD